MNPKFRSAIAAAGVGVFFFASVPGPAQAVDNYPPGSKAVSCKVSTNSSRSQIKRDHASNAASTAGNKHDRTGHRFRLSIKNTRQKSGGPPYRGSAIQRWPCGARPRTR